MSAPEERIEFEPFKNFRFRVKWDGQYIAGISRVSGLRRRTEVSQHYEGGHLAGSRKSPGRTEYEPLTLARGLTRDTAFRNWAELVQSQEKSFRKDIEVELYNARGELSLAFVVRRCWVSEYSPFPELDSSGNDTAMETITLEHEGWEILPWPEAS